MVCPAPSSVPFQYLAHLLTVPVQVGDVPMRFILDTGIGVNLISASAARTMGCAASGPDYTGRRMSGQEVTIPMGSLASVGVGDVRRDDVPAGIFDIGAAAGLDGIDGFLSLDFFRSTPVTVDYAASTLVLEDEASLARRAQAGAAAGVDVERDGPATQVRLTGHAFARYFTTLRGEVSVAGAPRIRQADPEVMFQRIIYDGLVGNSFLKNFTVTYDLPNARMIFALPPGSDD
jgi:hypothetical protein